MYVATATLGVPLERDDMVIMHNEPGTAVALHPGTGVSGSPSCSDLKSESIIAIPTRAGTCCSRYMPTSAGVRRNCCLAILRLKMSTSTASAGSECRPGRTAA